MHDSDDIREQDRVSKSRRKREMHARQALGLRLTGLSAELLARMELPEKLLDAIAEYKRLPNSHEARRRQLQYIGRLMRDVDPAPIRAILEEAGRDVEREKRRHQTIESFRDRLVDGDDEMLKRLIDEYPAVDIQHLRQLIRQSRKERAENKPPAAARKLFRYLNELMQPQD